VVNNFLQISNQWTFPLVWAIIYRIWFSIKTRLCSWNAFLRRCLKCNVSSCINSDIVTSYLPLQIAFCNFKQKLRWIETSHRKTVVTILTYTSFNVHWQFLGSINLKYFCLKKWVQIFWFSQKFVWRYIGFRRAMVKKIKVWKSTENKKFSNSRHFRSPWDFRRWVGGEYRRNHNLRIISLTNVFHTFFLNFQPQLRRNEKESLHSKTFITFLQPFSHEYNKYVTYSNQYKCTYCTCM